MKSSVGKKGYFGKHAKSSAMLVSLAIHATLILVAVSFVAVKVIVKDESSFESKTVKRPKIQLKKLVVPVNVKKKPPKPKLVKRLVVKPRLNQNIPDIKMPEITGVKGGMGSGVGDAGFGAGGLGFTMPEINLFGVKSKGEKIFIMLNSNSWMMVDEIGGMTAYAIIKNELVKILGELNPTVLFNISVYSGMQAQVLFPGWVSASSENVGKVKEWLAPLNMVEEGMSDNAYGLKTLGAGGSGITEDFAAEPFERMESWAIPTMLAMKQQADSLYVLTCRWGLQRKSVSKGAKTNDAVVRRWEEAYEKAKVKLEQENEERRKKGMPPRVFKNKGDMITSYFPNARGPAISKELYLFTPQDFEDLMNATRSKWIPKKTQKSSGIAKNKPDRYTFNVVHFVGRKGGSPNDETYFKKLTSLTGGEYRTLAGLEAIQSAVKPENLE
ncbi:vWA domain-containing protein [Pontiella sulfatireligans]|uniref:Uncharacterized protein n=1 Tax=Pontiella sulfatireligans TaxID=2750658 RepID=A0A6C2UEH1_9BACT|nr:hypothetical protein [Pontiella sulfatireligans]VGO18612.1 hypothetical protein SCARR_00665 [Pontiella sulfatireligans]